MTDTTRLHAALAIVDARYQGRSDLASSRLSHADAREAIDVLTLEFGATIYRQPVTGPTQDTATRSTFTCCDISGTAQGRENAALLAWTIAARAALSVEDVA